MPHIALSDINRFKEDAPPDFGRLAMRFREPGKDTKKTIALSDAAYKVLKTYRRVWVDRESDSAIAVPNEALKVLTDSAPVEVSRFFNRGVDSNETVKVTPLRCSRIVKWLLHHHSGTAHAEASQRHTKVITLTLEEIEEMCAKGPRNITTFINSRRIKEKDTPETKSFYKGDLDHFKKWIRAHAYPKVRHGGYKSQSPRLAGGPGTELKKLLAKVGVKVTATCHCNAHAIEMDYRGAEWCERNIDTVVQWLAEEVDRRKRDENTGILDRGRLLLFTELSGRELVKHAIRRAKAKEAKTPKPSGPVFVSFFTEGNGYRDEASQLAKTLSDVRVEYDIRPVKLAGDWAANTQIKPRFLKDMLAAYPGRPLVWVDADARVKKKPELFWNLSCDVAAVWRADKELLTSTVYFAPTCEPILDAWIAENERNPKGRFGDQHNFQNLVERMEKAGQVKTIRLPQTYAAIFDGNMCKPGEEVIAQMQASRRLKNPKAPKAPDTNASTFYSRDRKPVSLTNLYKNGACFLIAGGPSFANVNQQLLRQPGILTMGMNNAVRSFRTNLWTCVDNPSHFMESIWKDPTMLKFAPEWHADQPVWKSNAEEHTGLKVRDCPGVFLYSQNSHFFPETFLTEPSVNWGNDEQHGGGRSVMLAAVRILYTLGIRRLFLLGVDFKMSADYAYHFSQGRGPSSVKGNNTTYTKLRDRFTALRPIFEKSGLHVFNCNPDSGLKVFDFLSVEEAVAMALKDFPDTVMERTDGLYERSDKKLPTQKQ